jgi:glucosyl-dolichyl phosphate glucuronosyltransferase
MPVAISVVICAYTERRWDDLLTAVRSVQEQTVPALETIVVVDHNPRLLRRLRGQLPGVLVVNNHEQQGLSGARNSGVAAASGTVVAFLDDDATAAPDWLRWLAAGYRRPEVLGVGGAIEPVWAGRQRPRLLPEEFYWVVGCTYRGMPSATAAVRNLIGANMSFRRPIFGEVGGFQADLGRIGTRPGGCEETELCIRVRWRWPEGEFLYEPRALVRHRVPPERMTWRYFGARCYAEGLSKAMVTQRTDIRAGLAVERSYALHALPRGMARGLADTVRHGDSTGLGRAAVIAAGLAITTAGYVMGTTSPQVMGWRRWRRLEPSSGRRT